MLVKPFLKWAGGKFRILDRILPELAPGKRFVEPFAGSCAVYLNAEYKEALVADLNADLISLYRSVQREGEEFIKFCGSFFNPENNTREAFFALRDRFNRSSDSRERGALLLYLNRHAFNGLVRYNAKGGYNVPFGRYKKPYFPLEELKAFHRKTKLTATEFVCLDFRSVFADLEKGDVVYCDPPYVPLSETASFTAYSGNSFGAEDQRDLAALAKEASAKGVPVLLSNHDTEETRSLYSSAVVKSFEVQRFISCKGSSRGAVKELLAIYR